MPSARRPAAPAGRGSRAYSDAPPDRMRLWSHPPLPCLDRVLIPHHARIRSYWIVTLSSLFWIVLKSRKMHECLQCCSPAGSRRKSTESVTAARTRHGAGSPAQQKGAQLGTRVCAPCCLRPHDPRSSFRLLPFQPSACRMRVRLSPEFPGNTGVSRVRPTRPTRRLKTFRKKMRIESAWQTSRLSLSCQ